MGSKTWVKVKTVKFYYIYFIFDVSYNFYLLKVFFNIIILKFTIETNQIDDGEGKNKVSIVPGYL